MKYGYKDGVYAGVDVQDGQDSLRRKYQAEGRVDEWRDEKGEDEAPPEETYAANTGGSDYDLGDLVALGVTEGESFPTFDFSDEDGGDPGKTGTKGGGSLASALKKIFKGGRK